MPYSIKVHTDPPAAVFTFEGRIDPVKDVESVFQWVVAHQHEVVDVIHDVTHLNMTFSEAVVAAATAFAPRIGRKQPELDVVFVGLSGIFKSAVGILSQPQYSNRKVRVYETVDAALQASREKIRVA